MPLEAPPRFTISASETYKKHINGSIRMTAVHLSTDMLHNPLDVAELVIMEKDWVFDRPGEGELLAEVSGLWGKYRIWFNWQEEAGGLTIGCGYEARIPAGALPRVYALLALANAKLWLGHFEVNPDDSTVNFRHTVLAAGGAGVSAEQLQSLVDLAVQECERFHPAFQSVTWGGKSAAEALEIAIFETIAEA